MQQFEEIISLLTEIQAADGYQIELLQYHLAKSYFSLSIQKYNNGFIELAKDYLDKAYSNILACETVLVYQVNE